MKLIIQNNRIARAPRQRRKNSSVRMTASRTNRAKEACMAGGICFTGHGVDLAMQPITVFDSTTLTMGGLL